jgi:hypothetical protein
MTGRILSIGRSDLLDFRGGTESPEDLILIA